MADIPHLAIPFNFNTFGSHAQEREQDSDDDVRDCCEAVVRTIKGTRIDIPRFGITALEFSEKVDLDRLRAEIIEWEPRAEIYLSLNPDALDELGELAASIRVEIGGPYAQS